MSSLVPYLDRLEAGDTLAVAVRRFGIHHEGVILGIPRGGVVVAARIAERLGLDLDVIVARKIGAPGHQELAIGAVTADGSRYLNRALISRLGLSETYLAAATEAAGHEAARREALLRREHPPVDLHGRTAVVVDDGLATGATMRAAVMAARHRGAARVVVAVPVGAAPECDELRHEVAGLICPMERNDLDAIGRFYERFESVDEEEVRRLLGASAAAAPGG
ncbi:MAG: phosphoribosyltransferase [Gemmatimonadales bacterium]